MCNRRVQSVGAHYIINTSKERYGAPIKDNPFLLLVLLRLDIWKHKENKKPNVGEKKNGGKDMKRRHVTLPLLFYTYLVNS